MAFINRRKTKGAVTGSIGVKYPNIKICILAPTPEATGLNIQMSIIGGVGRCTASGSYGREADEIQVDFKILKLLCRLIYLDFYFA